MSKFLRTLVLMTALGGLATSTVSIAQDKKKADEKKPADTKKTEPKKVEEKVDGSIELVKNDKGWRYRIKNAEGKTIAMPLPQMSWETKEEVLKSIAELKAILNTAKPMEEKAK